MSIFKMFGFGSNNNSAEVTRLQAENEQLQDQLAQAQDQAPEVVYEEVEVEVPVEVEVTRPTLTVVAIQFQAKSTVIPVEDYADIYAGEMTVRQFVEQVMPSADTDLMSNITLISPDGSSESYSMDDVLPEEVPAQVSIAQTSGAGE